MKTPHFFLLVAASMACALLPMPLRAQITPFPGGTPTPVADCNAPANLPIFKNPFVAGYNNSSWPALTNGFHTSVASMKINYRDNGGYCWAYGEAWRALSYGFTGTNRAIANGPINYCYQNFPIEEYVEYRYRSMKNSYVELDRPLEELGSLQFADTVYTLLRTTPTVTCYGSNLPITRNQMIPVGGTGGESAVSWELYGTDHSNYIGRGSGTFIDLSPYRTELAKLAKLKVILRISYWGSSSSTIIADVTIAARMASSLMFHSEYAKDGDGNFVLIDDSIQPMAEEIDLTDCKAQGLALEFDGAVLHTECKAMLASPNGTSSTFTVYRWESSPRKVLFDIGENKIEFPSTVTLSYNNDKYRYVINEPKSTEYISLAPVTYAERNTDKCAGTQISIHPGSWTISVPLSQASYNAPWYTVAKDRSTIDVTKTYHTCQLVQTLTNITVAKIPKATVNVSLSFSPTVDIKVEPLENVSEVNAEIYNVLTGEYSYPKFSLNSKGQYISTTSVDDDDDTFDVTVMLKSIMGCKEDISRQIVAGMVKSASNQANRMSLLSVSSIAQESMGTAMMTDSTPVISTTYFTTQLYPNPSSAGQATNLQVEAQQGGAATIQVSNVFSGAMKTKKVTLAPGANVIDISNLLPRQGVYSVQITYPDNTQELLKGIAQ